MRRSVAASLALLLAALRALRADEPAASNLSFVEECDARLHWNRGYWGNCVPERILDLESGERADLVARAHAALATMRANSTLMFFGDSLARDIFILLACVLVRDLTHLPTGNTSSRSFGLYRVESFTTRGVEVIFARLREPHYGKRPYINLRIYPAVLSAIRSAGHITTTYISHSVSGALFDLQMDKFLAMVKEARGRAPGKPQVLPAMPNISLWEYLPVHFPGSPDGDFEGHKRWLNRRARHRRQAINVSTLACVVQPFSPKGRAAGEKQPGPWRLSATRSYAAKKSLALVPLWEQSVNAYDDHCEHSKGSFDCRHWCNPGRTQLRNLRTLLQVLEEPAHFVPPKPPPPKPPPPKPAAADKAHAPEPQSPAQQASTIGLEASGGASNTTLNSTSVGVEGQARDTARGAAGKTARLRRVLSAGANLRRNAVAADDASEPLPGLAWLSIPPPDTDDPDRDWF